MKAALIVFLLMNYAPSETKVDLSSPFRKMAMGPPMVQSCFESGEATACPVLADKFYEIVENVTCHYDRDDNPQVRKCSFELGSRAGMNKCVLTEYWSVSVVGGFWRSKLIIPKTPKAPKSRADDQDQIAVDAAPFKTAPVELSCSVNIADYARRVRALSQAPVIKSKD